MEKIIESRAAAFAQGKYPTLAEDVAHAIEKNDDAALGSSPAMRRYSDENMEFILQTVKELEQAGMIVEAKDPTIFASQVHVVRLPGKDPRFCVDYRRINDATKPDSFPLPRMDELIYSFNGCSIFSTMDAAKGFWQIPTGKGQELKAFRVKGKVYYWKVMPMGLKNAPNISEIYGAGFCGLRLCENLHR